MPLEVSPEELLARERQARAEAEAAQQRLQFLFHATSALFAQPLSGASKLNTLARLVVPHVADWCIVDVVEREAMNRVAVNHWDPARVTAAAHLLGRFASDPAAREGAGLVLRDKTAHIIGDVAAAARLVPASDSVRVLHELGARSLALVPLLGTQQPLGVVTFAFAESHRSYGAEELDILRDLCTRAAWAVENAVLHEQTERAVAARDELLAVVSHDLRNPLSAIAMAANLLRKGGAADRERTLRNAERIARGAGQMERLISDLLDLAAIEKGHLRVELAPWRVGTLVAEAMELMGPLARERRLQLGATVGDPEAMVLCDRDRTLQVFSNLIGNAVKFTPEGGLIDVHVHSDGDVVRVSVRDTGPGIAADELPHIFDRYWQAKRTDRRGVGLGLSIADGIVAAQGGRIAVESTVGAGTTFRFTLRRAS